MTDLMSPNYAAEFLLANGHSVRQQPQLALEWCLAQARNGSMEAQCVLATLLWFGLAGVHDEEQAKYWCSSAALAGSLDAQCVLAARQVSSRGEDRNLVKGLADLEHLVSRGHVPAMVTLALLKLFGHVAEVSQDTPEALDLLLIPAESGHTYAQCLLGSELIQDASESNQQAGVRWLLQAAEGGDATAHEFLSTFYRNGLHGLPIDHDRADRHAKSARPPVLGD
jgi:TPR repeat protein